MNTLVIGIAIVLVLAILILMFRIQTLLNVMSGSYRKIGGMSNRINALLFVIFAVVGFIAIFWYNDIASAHYLPEPSSIHGKDTDFMFWLTIVILIVAFIVTHIFLIGFVFKYQYRENNKAHFYPENHRLEFVWTIIPAIVMAVLVYYGWKTWTDIMKAEPKDSVVVELMGQQFEWNIRYPGNDQKLGTYSYRKISPDNPMGLVPEDEDNWDDVTSNILYLPKGVPVLLQIRARDVLHSVYLPHFRVKMDAVPGMPTKFWFVPTKTTQEMRQELGNAEFNYELACAELCGRAHFSMRRVVVVLDPDEYKKWMASQKTFSETAREYLKKELPDNMKNRLAQPVAEEVK